MYMATLRSAALVLLLALVGCDYVPFSAGEVSGTLTPAPADWTGQAEERVVRLETNPADPYSVKLWVIGMGPYLYFHAGANRATWVEHIEADPRVRVLMGEKLYELQAQPVRDAEEFARFSAAYEAKYGNPPRNDNIEEVYLFRLLPRT